jgi:hypothetical protein
MGNRVGVKEIWLRKRRGETEASDMRRPDDGRSLSLPEETDGFRDRYFLLRPAVLLRHLSGLFAIRRRARDIRHDVVD